MDSNSIAQILNVAKELGVVGTPAIALLLISYFVINKPKSEPSPFMTRADFDKLENRMREVEASLNQIKGALGVK